MGLARWKIEHDTAGHDCRVEINGKPVEHQLRHLRLDLARNEISRLTVEFMGDDGTIEGEGVVQVASAPTRDDLAAYFLEWLDEQDPDDIAQQMADMPMNVGPVEAVLDALRKRAVSG